MNHGSPTLLAARPDTTRVESGADGLRERYDATEREALRQLTLGIVHDMNNALSGIVMLSEIYQAAADDSGPGEGFKLIHKSARRLQTLVAHLKTLNGETTGEAAYINLSETVPTFFEMFAPMLPKTLGVANETAAAEIVVRADEAELRHILLNLALNIRDALQTSPDAAKTLQIVVSRHADNFARIVLSVNGLTEDRHPDAQARLDDAENRLRDMGGTLIATVSGEFALELPLVT